MILQRLLVFVDLWRKMCICAVFMAPIAIKMGTTNRVSGFGHFFYWVFCCLNLRFPGNSEVQERFRVQIVRFTLAVVALPDVLDDVLRNRQQVQLLLLDGMKKRSRWEQISL